MSLEKRTALSDVTCIDIDITKIIDFHSEADHFSLRSKDSLTLKNFFFNATLFTIPTLTLLTLLLH